MRIFRAGRANDASSRRSASEQGLAKAGMTLIELMVGMAVVGVILSVAVAGLRSFTDTEMKEVANRMASTIRYLYNKSATERLYIRIVYDFEDHSYHVESTDNPFLITPTDSETEAADDADDNEEPKEEVFSAEESYLLKPVKLGGQYLL